MSKKLMLVLDVETAGGLDEKIVYDLGFAVVAKDGKIVEEYSFIIEEIFNDSTLMNSAYYAEKVPSYLREIEQGLHKVVPFKVALDTLREVIARYDLKIVSAYNLAFDLDAIWKTSKRLLGYNYGFKGMTRLCIMSFACEVLFTQKTYQKMAIAQGWVSPAGNVRTTAEMAYRYIRVNPSFVEEHKGLADVRIEAQILAKCFRQKKAHKSGMIGNAWKIPNTKELKMARTPVLA